MPRPSWIPKLLAGMGWPDDGATSLALDLWSRSEDGSYRMQNTCHNYIAITYPQGDRAPWNSFKSGGKTYNVQCYSSEEKGVAATVEFLNQGAYSEVDQRFRAQFLKGAKISSIYFAINAAPFCAGCQGGHYPIMLYNYLFRKRGGKGFSPYPGGYAPPPRAKVDITIFTAWHDFTRQLSRTFPAVIRKLDAETRLIRRNSR